jgi:hypothetical protein
MSWQALDVVVRHSSAISAFMDAIGSLVLELWHLLDLWKLLEFVTGMFGKFRDATWKHAMQFSATSHREDSRDKVFGRWRVFKPH